MIRLPGPVYAALGIAAFVAFYYALVAFGFVAGSIAEASESGLIGVLLQSGLFGIGIIVGLFVFLKFIAVLLRNKSGE